MLTNDSDFINKIQARAVQKITDEETLRIKEFHIEQITLKVLKNFMKRHGVKTSEQLYKDVNKQVKRIFG